MPMKYVYKFGEKIYVDILVRFYLIFAKIKSSRISFFALFGCYFNWAIWSDFLLTSFFCILRNVLRLLCVFLIDSSSWTLNYFTNHHLSSFAVAIKWLFSRVISFFSLIFFSQMTNYSFAFGGRLNAMKIIV